MAKKITGLPAGTTPTGALAEIFEVVQAGASKRLTLAQIATGIAAEADPLPAADVSVEDVETLFTGTNVEDVLEEIGEALEVLTSRQTQCIMVVCSDETTALAAETLPLVFHMPYAFTLTGEKIRCGLSTPQATGSIFTVDVKQNGTSILSTKVTIDNTEETSNTATTPPVVSDDTLANAAKMTVVIDQIGDSTAKGLKLYLIGYPT